jgi:adenylyltransferase/sulfurtransferase
MIRQISPADLAKRLANGHAITLIDVRQPWENELAALPDSKLIPLNELANRKEELASLSGSAVVCYCHHGIRSQSAAAFLEKCGVKEVYSLTGGIDAWSCEVDPAVPRY